ncbi:chondroitin sulfate N-acetylgalactosaminyltransferase 1-like [Sycon ciliatum]|uniref:chondroitin sulfate N-acetylgalactosaminyltransferase 1-like n=1 Tax=Sycon ciliatum TaxID=27933 RepID=UPI0031F65AC9
MLFANNSANGDGVWAHVTMRFSAVRIVKLLAFINLLLIVVWLIVARCYQGARLPDKALSGVSAAGGDPELETLEQLFTDIEKLRGVVEEKRQEASKLESSVQVEQAWIRRDEPPTRATLGKPLSDADAKEAYRRMLALAPKNEYDNTPWSMFNRTHYYHSSVGVGRESGGVLAGWRLREAEMVLSTAADSLPSWYAKDGFLEGFRCLKRHYGMVYELYFTDNKSKTDVRRVRVVRALGNLTASDIGMEPAALLGNDLKRALVSTGERAKHSLHEVEPSRRLLHFVLPVVHSSTKHLLEFLDYFIANVLGVKAGATYAASMDLHLTVVIVMADMTLADRLEAAVRGRCRGVGFDDVTFQRLVDRFDTSAVLRAAMVYSPGDGVVVSLINVDTRFNKESAKRCRYLPERGLRVYWPVAFRLYNVRLAHGKSADEVPLAKRLRLAASGGFWAEQDYDVFCMFGSDVKSVLSNVSLDSVTRQSLSLSTLAFYRQFARSSRFSIVRLPDRSLFRVHRPAKCALNAVQNPVDARAEEKRYDRCRERKARNLASHKTLAHLALGPQADRDKILAEETLLLDEMEAK